MKNAAFARRSRFALMVLIVAMVLSLSACGGSKTKENPADAGEEKHFTFEVYHADGEVKEFEISTTKSTVGAALMDEKLIAGDDGEFGLYVKTVDGATWEYEKDGKYWAFYLGDEYAPTGVDVTEIEDGAVYSFRVE